MAQQIPLKNVGRYMVALGARYTGKNQAGQSVYKTPSGNVYVVIEQGNVAVVKQVQKCKC